MSLSFYFGWMGYVLPPEALKNIFLTLNQKDWLKPPSIFESNPVA